MQLSTRKYEKYPRLEQHENGTWYAFYKQSGIRKRQSLNTGDSRIAAKKFSDLCEDLDRGILGFSLKPQPIVFSKFARRFLEEADWLSEISLKRHRQNLFGTKHKTDDSGKITEEYEEQKGPLIKAFGSKDMKSITAPDVAAYIRRRLGQGLSPNAVHKEWSTMSAMFRYAMELGLAFANPVLAVRKPKIMPVRPNRTPTEEDLLKIFENMNPRSRRYFLALCNTGCRRAEMSDCNVADADLERKVLTVTGKGMKTRALPMNDELIVVVKEELASRPNVKPDDPLFVSRLGNRYKSIRSALDTACEKAGVDRLTHHSLRHAYATIMSEKDVALERISQLLGHTSVVVTQTIYIKQPNAPLRQAAESFSIGGTKKAKTWQNSSRRKKGVA